MHKRSHNELENTPTVSTTSDEGEKADSEPPQRKTKLDDEIENFESEAFKNIVEATRCSNALPQDSARELYLTYPGYSRVEDDQSQRVLDILGTLLRTQKISGDIQRRQLDEQFEMVQECNDILFERITTNLDIKSGLRRGHHIVLETQVDVPSEVASTNPPTDNAALELPTTSETAISSPTPRAGSWNRTYISPNITPTLGKVAARLYTAKNILRPQMTFKVPVDNNPLTPFVPRLSEKPNSLKPLALLPEYDDAGNIYAYLHPYEFELLKFEPPPVQLANKDPQMPLPTVETELFFVDTVEKLREALEELRQVQEIAIDVEHHSYRTFMGITCLVQMSTRYKDYIFDTLVLRDDMHILNLVLTDPKVLKILHGADMDIEWLQRDLSLYIVNMFDTHRAAKILGMARLSLAYLLKHYVDIDVDKSFQLADWRMRPLPEELINYARQDTHFLIYIYEKLTNDLLQLEHGNVQPLRTVYQMSTEVCKKRYFKPYISQETHMDLVRKMKRTFDNRQLYALRALVAWRDMTARQEDESYGYVLPNHMMLQIAESLPREMQGILACCNPIPPIVRQQLHVLHHIVLRAREQPLIKPIAEDRSTIPTRAPTTKDFNSKLYCPHDFSHIDETRDDLPTLLKRNAAGKLKLSVASIVAEPSVSIMPALALYGKPLRPTADDELHWSRLRQKRLDQRMPYKRYLAILPIMEQLKTEQELRERSEELKRRLCPSAPSTDDIKLELITQADPAADEPDLYSLPLKEQLKRKHQQKKIEQPVVAKRIKKDSQNTQRACELKSESKSKTEPISTTPDVSTAAVAAAYSDNEAVDEMPIERQPPTQPNNKKKPQKQHKKQRFQRKSHMPSAQSSNRAIELPKSEAGQNFDYKQVDYKQFQGGAKRARGTQINTQMRGKNRPNNRNNKQFNKLFTFSNVKKDGKK